MTADENTTSEESPEEVTEESPNPKTFDLLAALAGRSYPKETIKVFFDEQAMYAYGQAQDMLDHDPRNEELKKAIDTMLEDLKEMTYLVTVQGIPTHVMDSISESVLEDFPVKRDSRGNAKNDFEADKEFHNRLWQAYVVEITDPTGAKANLTKEAIEQFRKVAPAATVKAVNEAINKLRDYADNGYESAVTELDFLSRPSPKG